MNHNAAHNDRVLREEYWNDPDLYINDEEEKPSPPIRFGIHIKTIIKSKGVIEQTEDDMFLNQQITRVVNTRENHIRQGLIALGWTPPKEEG